MFSFLARHPRSLEPKGSPLLALYTQKVAEQLFSEPGRGWGANKLRRGSSLGQFSWIHCWGVSLLLPKGLCPSGIPPPPPPCVPPLAQERLGEGDPGNARGLANAGPPVPPPPSKQLRKALSIRRTPPPACYKQGGSHQGHKPGRGPIYSISFFRLDSPDQREGKGL